MSYAPLLPDAGFIPSGRARRRRRGWAIAVAVVPLLLAVAGWLLVRQAQGASEESRLQPAGAREPEWRTAVREAEQARSALQALRDLEVVPAARLTYREYHDRVAAVKVRVDPYVESIGGRADVKAEMRAALALYALAGTAWDAKIRRAYREGRLAQDPRLGLCPPVVHAVEESRELPYLSRALAREIAVVANVPSLWECAAQRTSLLATHTPEL